MIYQLKITIKDISPPVWRRILVEGNMLLSELHEVIQIAFEWWDYHLHCFEARMTNGVRLTNQRILIGRKDEEYDFMNEYDYDESEEKLSDWLVKEKDKLVYVYDFGDDWQHEIVLEKILEPEPGLLYPYCVKAMRGPLPEDNRAYIEDSDAFDPDDIPDWIKDKEKLSPEELIETINAQLSEIAREVVTSSAVKPEKSPKGGWKRLLHLAREFSELAPWRWMDDDQIFAVLHPETREIAFCSVMGGQEEEFGLAAFLGEEGLHYLNRIMTGSPLSENAFYEQKSLVLTFCDRNEISDKDYQLIKKAGFSFRGKKKWPMFRSMVPGYYPWHLSEEEIEWFSIILERAIYVCSCVKNDLAISFFHESDTCFTQMPTVTKHGIIWKDTYVLKSKDTNGDQPCSILVDEVEIQRIKTRLKRFDVPLEIGVFYSPTPVQEHPDQRPFLPLVFAAAERKNGMILYHTVLLPESHDVQIQASFINLLEKLGAVPKEVWLEKDTFLILKLILKRLKISAVEVEKLPIILELKNSMYEYFG